MALSNFGIVAVLALITYLVLFRRHTRLRAAGRSGARMRSASRPDESPTAPVGAPGSAAAAASGPSEPKMCTHSVSIEADLLPCEAAKRLADQRFLSSEAPPLPLPDCDRDQCDCRYEHHADRRTHEERRTPFPTRGGFGLTIGDERRESADRRRS